jgi:hypothetical protein
MVIRVPAPSDDKLRRLSRRLKSFYARLKIHPTLPTNKAGGSAR